MAVLSVVVGTHGLGESWERRRPNALPCSCHVKDQSSPVGGNADVGSGLVMRRFRSGSLNMTITGTRFL